MIHPVYVYIDGNGNVTEWVISDDDEYNPSERPGMVRVSVPRKDYDILPPALNVGGIAVCHELTKLCIPVLMVTNSKLAAVCQAKCDALDVKIAADAQKEVLDQAAALAAWNVLPQATKDTFIAADTALAAQVILDL